MTTYEIHGDRSLLFDVSEVSFHLRMGKKRTENYLHYLWLEKIIIPVRYRKIGSEPYWEKSSIDSLLKISKEEWDGLKIPEFDPKKNYKSMILKFPISKKTKNTILMKNKTNKLYAINTRIPIDLAEKMNSHLAITKQSASSFILDSVMEYLDLIYNKDYEPSKALKLNQYANELEKSLP